MKQLEPYLPYLIPLIPILVGALASALEKFGKARDIAWLVAIAQRLEALTVDLPKLLAGSRATKIEKTLEAAGTSLPEVIGAAQREAKKKSIPPLSDRAPSTRSITPPGGYPGAGLVLLIALAANSEACGAKPEVAPCDPGTLAGIITECATRVELECASKGIPEADCEPLKECDARIDARTESCRK